MLNFILPLFFLSVAITYIQHTMALNDLTNTITLLLMINLNMMWASLALQKK
jgi:hypothetical protein